MYRRRSPHLEVHVLCKAPTFNIKYLQNIVNCIHYTNRHNYLELCNTVHTWIGRSHRLVTLSFTVRRSEFRVISPLEGIMAPGTECSYQVTVIKHQCQSLVKVCPEKFQFKFQNHRAFQLALMPTLKGSETTESTFCISNHLYFQ